MSSKAEEEDSKQDANGPGEGVDLPLNLIKSLRRKGTTNSSEGGSSSSNVEGNNSDNSALVSLGNTSFGFNFDSEEGTSAPSSEKSGESDSDGGSRENCSSKPEGGDNRSSQSNSKLDEKTPDESTNAEDAKPQVSEGTAQHQHVSVSESDTAPTASQTSSSSSDAPPANDNNFAVSDASSLHKMAADAAVANLHSIASAFMKKNESEDDKKNSYNNDDRGHYSNANEGGNAHADQAFSSGTQSVGGTSSANGDQNSQNADDDDDDDDDRPKKKKRVNDKKREERNAREKERSFRISKQINELRNLLSSGGVIVPKGTKSSVLTEAANYIRMLQQHQYRSEIDRHQLVQQIQMIGGGAHGPQAAQAIRHVAAKNGVWSLGNFGGVPPKSAMGYYQPGNGESTTEMQAPVDPIQQTKIEEHEYRSVFNNCAVGMAIASMGGAFIDCNNLFCQLSNYTKQEVCALTIFNLTARQDLQHAFDLISQLISPPMDTPSSGPQQPIVLRGAMNNRNDLGLGVALVKGNDGIAKFFCVTLIKNPASPFDDSKPIPATIELIQGTPSLTRQMPKDGAGLDSAPAFTTG